MWSGIIGDALAGVVMLVVLVITLFVQVCQNKELMEHQQEQFNRQLKANEELLARQLELEREAASSREILRLRTEVQRAFLSIELIVTTGEGYKDFPELRYRVLALNREIKSHLVPAVRDEYRNLADVYDKVIGQLGDLVNLSGGPITVEREKLGTMLGGLIALQEEWVEAYIDGNEKERSRLYSMIKSSQRSFEN